MLVLVDVGVAVLVDVEVDVGVIVGVGDGVCGVDVGVNGKAKPKLIVITSLLVTLAVAGLPSLVVSSYPTGVSDVTEYKPNAIVVKV